MQWGNGRIQQRCLDDSDVTYDPYELDVSWPGEQLSTDEDIV
jgi:hypothetical protein